MESRTPESKPTRGEVRRRIDITESLLIDCASVTEIRRYFAEKEGLELGRRTVERYAHIAEQRIEKTAEPLRKVEIRKAKRRFERCFARAMSGGKKNIFAAIAAQKSMNAMLGLNAPKEKVLEMVMRDERSVKNYTALYDGKRIDELNDREFEEVQQGIDEDRMAVHDGMLVCKDDPGFLQEMHDQFRSRLEERMREGELQQTLKEMGYRLTAR